MCDLDTLCYSLYAPSEWAGRAAMPDMRQHFSNVADQILRRDENPRFPVRERPQRTLDLARAASEVGL